MDFDEASRVVEAAVVRGEVIRIHPLDLAQQLNDNASEQIDVFKVSMAKTDTHLLIEGKTYLSTVYAERK